MMKDIFKTLVFAWLIAIITVTSTVHASYLDRPHACEGNYAHVDYVSTNKITPTASSDGGTVTVSVLVSTKNAKTSSSGTLYVEMKTKSGWKSKGSWTFEGKGKYSVSHDYSGKKGKYRTHVIATIGGDKVNVYSSEITVN